MKSEPSQENQRPTVSADVQASVGVTKIARDLWNLSDVLRDDSIPYVDFVFELTTLVVIKISDIADRNGICMPLVFPEGISWQSFAGLAGIKLLNSYRETLLRLRESSDSNVSAIFAGAASGMKNPKSLEILIRKINAVDWDAAIALGLGNLYDAFLQINYAQTKSGAALYYTPRALVKSIVGLLKPAIGEVVYDPAAGTAGFLIEADKYRRIHHNTTVHNSVQATITGLELSARSRRLALVSCLFHRMDGGGSCTVEIGNSLESDTIRTSNADIVLSNFPLGVLCAQPIDSDEEFAVQSKPLAFLRKTIRDMKEGSRAAIVVPDSVLSDLDGAPIRHQLLDECDLHTILRLPTGIFYAPGVKINVLFFRKLRSGAAGSTEDVWVYDMRTDAPTYGTRSPIGQEHFVEFESAYGSDIYGKSDRLDTGQSGRFRKFPLACIGDLSKYLDAAKM